MKIEDIDLSLIKEAGFQLRTDIRGQDFERLKESIKTHGVMQPVLLRPKGKGYQIVAGTRRVEACKELGLRSVPAIVRELDDKTAFELALSENIQRNQLTPFEEAHAFLDYVDKYKWGSITELSGKVHRSHSYIVNRLKLLELPKKITEEIVPSEQFTASHAEELLRLERPEQMEEVARKIKAEKLTTSQTAEVVDLVKERKVSVDKAVKTVKIVQKTRERAEEVAEQLKNVLVETQPEKLEGVSEIVSDELSGLTRRLENRTITDQPRLEVSPELLERADEAARGVAGPLGEALTKAAEEARIARTSEERRLLENYMFLGSIIQALTGRKIFCTAHDDEEPMLTWSCGTSITKTHEQLRTKLRLDK